MCVDFGKYTAVHDIARPYLRVHVLSVGLGRAGSGGKIVCSVVRLSQLMVC
eukprot:SAG31_NODE_33637_length_341_cov_1.198347_1_plen_50_part_01